MRKIGFLLFGALLAGLIGGALGSFWISSRTTPATSSPETPVVYLPLRQARSENPTDASFIEAAKRATPSVVFIRGYGERMAGEDFWSFWGLWLPRSQPIYSAGSGVVWSSDGYIVTNFHVVREAQRILVSFPDKRTLEAEFIGGDASADIALLKVKATGLTSLPLGNSDSVAIGQWVLAIGNPYNLTYTVTAGIISARGRNLNLLKGPLPIESFLQTDAAINPGNSGGALVDLSGRLLGINTAIASRTGSYVGYGFAIPINIVKKVVADLKEFGVVQRAFLDADVQDLPDEGPTTASAEELAGLFVKAVYPGGAAEKAGLRAGDRILKVDGLPLQTQAELAERLAQKRPGDKIRLTYKRHNQILETTATLTNEDGETTLLRRKPYRSEALGADLTPISKREATELGLKRGFRITNLRRGLLSQMGLQEGTIIVSVNRYIPETPEELENILLSSRGRLLIEGVDAYGKPFFYSFFQR
jgi:serine protease Do